MLNSTLENELRLIVENVYGPPVRSLPGLDIGRAYWGASKEFRYGGDMVDVFQYGAGYTSLAVVDIAGHGIRAAMHAGLVKFALRAYASRGFDALESMHALNRLCIENSRFEEDDEFFATAFFGIVGEDRRTMQYVSAGHEAAFLVGSTGNRPLDATGPIVGLMDDDHAFELATVAIEPLDIFVAVTDGFTEARDTNNRFLGTEAVVDVIERYRDNRAEYQAEAVTRRAFEYAGANLGDDVAALVVKFLAGAPAGSAR